MFPLPGAPRQQPVDPGRLKAFMDQPSGPTNNTAAKLTNARQSKRLFAYDIPASATEESLVDFFNLQLNGLNVTSTTDPCASAQLDGNHTFALLEFKSASDATVALAMDGIRMEAPETMTNGDSNGTAAPATASTAGLTIRRPRDYITPFAEGSEFQEGMVSNQVPDTANKVCISNLPLYLQEEQVTELVSSFGPLKSFVLAKDRDTDESRGFAFCEYVDSANTAIAVEGLNGMELGEKMLRVTLASVGSTQASGVDMGVNAMSMFASTTSTDLAKGRVLQLLNMVTAEELMDGEEYEGSLSASVLFLSLSLSLSVCLCLPVSNANILFNRNLRRHPRRMPKVRRRRRHEDSPSLRRQPPVRRCRQSFCQIRHGRVRRKCHESARRSQVCRPHGRDDLLF